jgi:hypothetical protein
MKPFYRLMVLAVLAALTACSAGSSESSGTSATGVQASMTGTPAATEFNFQLPATDQLLIGTLMLENSDQAVTPEQAAKLLPLWQLMKTLMESDTSVQAEIDAVLKQINAEMAGDQLTWIANQDFSNQNMFEIMQQLGISLSDSSGASTDRFSGNAGQGGGRPDFAPGEGGPGGGFAGGPGGGEFAGGEGLTPEMRATRQAMIEANGGTFQRRVNTMLIEPLITWLEARAAATATP